MDKKKILLLYYSGSGCTRTVGEIISKKISKSYEVEMIAFSPEMNYSIISDHDFLIIGYPTYYCKPPRSFVNFVENMPRFDDRKKAFIFTTYGFYNGNGLKILISKLLANNIITTNYAEIRGPGSDAVLFFPSFVKYFQRFEKRTKKKIDKFVSEIERLSKSSLNKPKIPRYKLYVLLNNIADYYGEKFYLSNLRENIKFLPDRCNNCGVCVKNCVFNCWKEGPDFPIFNRLKCEFCLKCIHNCPQKAIIFSKKMIDKPRFNSKFYNRLKAEILN